MSKAPKISLLDAEIQAWIEAQPRQVLFSELAAACLERFGAEHAWDVDRIRRYWEQAHPVLTRSPIDYDGELVAFIRDSMGRLRGDEMLAECRKRWPTKPLPSRTAIYRWIKADQIRRRNQQST